MIDTGFAVVAVLVVGMPVLVGLAMCFFGIRAWVRARNLVTTGTQISATIVDNQQESHSDGQMMFIPVVRFRTTDGREVTTALENAQSHRSHLTNTMVDILYDPSNPQHVQRAGSTTGGGVGAIVLGLVFLGFGILAFKLIHSAMADPMLDITHRFSAG
ncbi:DUF3592 domain-containing protein [Actinoplanes sp. TFC3]|uniref:DUF3592 domain-containing protein n=1 Tax=Actinoplanes sp. TFC3 TaxID=1710355 RepID=UPI000837309D|nr:DUF3592 domain-containing protein [Actinoplanes sp. TFC3]